MAMFVNQGKLDMGKMRGILEMRAAGIDLSSCSNEVAKMYDAILYQGYGFFEAPEVNGFRGSLKTIKDLDPLSPLLKTFTMEYGMKDFEYELQILKNDFKDQNNLQNKCDRKWTQYEKNQIQALIYKLEGYDDLAIDLWSRQVAKNPLDILSLTNAFPILLINGMASSISNLAGYSTKSMTKDNIFYPFIRSFEAFGLEERGQLDLALTMAEETIDMCPWNSWGIHTVAHVYHSKGKSDQGLKFLENSRQQWIPCNMLACHNSWHMAIFHLYNNNIDAALELWNNEVFTRLNEHFSYFLMSDAVALLSRIEMEQSSRVSRTNKIDLSSRWNKLFDSISHVIESDSVYNFYDAHLALALMFCNKKDLLNKLYERIEDYISKFENTILESWESGSTTTVNSSVRLQSNRFEVRFHVLIPLLKALKFFRDGEYKSAVNILYPQRYKLRSLGGSKAQNDIFQQTLATILLMSGDEDDISFLRMLLFERQEQMSVDYYGERMERRIIDNH